LSDKLRSDFLLQRAVSPLDATRDPIDYRPKAKGSEWQAVMVPFLGRCVIAPRRGIHASEKSGLKRGRSWR